MSGALALTLGERLELGGEFAAAHEAALPHRGGEHARHKGDAAGEEHRGDARHEPRAQEDRDADESL